MPAGNVDVVRAIYDAFNRGDDEPIGELWAPDAEWRPAMAGGVENRVYRGHDEIRRYRADLFTSFSSAQAEDAEFRDLGDRVLVLFRLVVRGRDSDVTIDQPIGAVYELRDGRVVRGQSYMDRRDALEAAGVEA